MANNITAIWPFVCLFPSLLKFHTSSHLYWNVRLVTEETFTLLGALLFVIISCYIMFQKHFSRITDTPQWFLTSTGIAKCTMKWLLPESNTNLTYKSGKQFPQSIFHWKGPFNLNKIFKCPFRVVLWRAVIICHCCNDAIKKSLWQWKWNYSNNYMFFSSSISWADRRLLPPQQNFWKKMCGLRT